MLDSKEKESLRKIFYQVDKDNTGMINFDELQDALQKTGHHLTQIEIKQIIENVYYAGSRKINYSECLVATIHIKEVLTYEKLWELFKYFDTDESGIITTQNLKEALAKTGKILTNSNIEYIRNAFFY